jgi:hypothetical protein
MAMRERKGDQLRTASAISAWRAASSPITTVQTKHFGGQVAPSIAPQIMRRTKSEYDRVDVPPALFSRTTVRFRGPSARLAGALHRSGGSVISSGRGKC